jgi:hypothetical protein
MNGRQVVTPLLCVCLLAGCVEQQVRAYARTQYGGSDVEVHEASLPGMVRCTIWGAVPLATDPVFSTFVRYPDGTFLHATGSAKKAEEAEKALALCSDATTPASALASLIALGTSGVVPSEIQLVKRDATATVIKFKTTPRHDAFDPPYICDAAPPGGVPPCGPPVTQTTATIRDGHLSLISKLLPRAP